MEKTLTALGMAWLGLAVFMPGCSDKVTHQVTGNYTIRYTVDIPSLPRDSLAVAVSMENWAYGDSVFLVAPPMYADNPLLEQTGLNFCNLAVYNKNGIPVAYALDSMQTGLYRSMTISFASAALPVTISYNVKFNYKNIPLPMPYLGAASGYLEGNYLFVIPCKNKLESMADLWRDQFDLSVHYVIGNSLSFYGDPIPTAFFNDPYELLFSTSVVSPQLLTEGTVNGQTFRLVTVDSTAFFSANLLTRVKNDFTVLLRDITTEFGTLENLPVTVILGEDPGGGFEGMHAFSVLAPWEQDPLGIFNMVITHEMLHSWVGIRCGEYDDPWWKEGTTSYLGFLITKRNDLCSQLYVEGTLLAHVADSSDVRDHALSEEYVRNNLFATPNCITLVYTKGAQVCMLLDSRIREATNGVLSLDKIVAEMVKNYNGRAFHRSAYLALIKTRSSADVTDIFSQYVDQPGAIPDAVLQASYRKLTAWGAFGSVVVAKRALPAEYGYSRTMMKW